MFSHEIVLRKMKKIKQVKVQLTYLNSTLPKKLKQFQMSRSKTVDRVKLLDEDGYRRIQDKDMHSPQGMWLPSKIDWAAFARSLILSRQTLYIINITTKMSDVMQNYSPSQDDDKNFGWKLGQVYPGPETKMA